MSDSAIAAVMTGLVTIVTVIVGFLTLWVRLRYGVEPKIDKNTAITEANGKEAVTAAQKASLKADDIANKLNGALENTITSIVKCHTEPIVALMAAHSEQDDKNMAEIRMALGELRDRTNK